MVKISSSWQIPLGVRDVLPEEAWQRRRLENALASLFETWAYREIIPPSFEYYENLKGESAEDQLFKLIDRNGRILALRPDLTTPIARMVASHLGNEPFPVRLYYLGNVFRYEDVQAGKQREFRQAGVELIGTNGTGADAEVIALAVETLSACDLPDFQVGIGQVALTHGLLEEAGIPGEHLREIKNIIAGKDYVGLEERLSVLGVEPANRKLVLNIPALRGNSQVIEKARALINSRRLQRALDNLEEVYQALEALGLAKNVFFDLSILRDFDYYTGIVFEGYAAGLGYPVCGGGRYDRLLGQFGLQAPATGFALGLERAMLASQKEKEHTGPNCLLVGNSLPELFKEAARLRSQQGQVVEIDTMGRTAAEAREYAQKRGIMRIINLGEVDHD